MRTCALHIQIRTQFLVGYLIEPTPNLFESFLKQENETFYLPTGAKSTSNSFGTFRSNRCIEPLIEATQLIANS